MGEVHDRDRRHHRGFQHGHDDLADQGRIDVGQRLGQYHEDEDFGGLDAERRARLALAGCHRPDAGAQDLDRIGGEVDGHRQDCRLDRREPDAELRQGEEDEEHLHDEGRVADRLDIGEDRDAHPAPRSTRRRGAADAEREAEAGGNRRQPQRHTHALEEQAEISGQRREIELVAH